MQCSDGSTSEVCTNQHTSIAFHLARNLVTVHVTSDPGDRCAEVVKSKQGLVLDLSDYNMDVR